MGLLEDETTSGGKVRLIIDGMFKQLKRQKRPHIVETEPFGNTFGPKAQRKRPRLDIGSIEELGESSTAPIPAESAGRSSVSLRYFMLTNALDPQSTAEMDAYHPTTSTAREPIYAKGTSRRIWGELYKVLDSSDVVIHVLDARDPLGTRCKPVVEYLRKEKAHKHLVYVLNKVDLVPTWATVSPACDHILLCALPFFCFLRHHALLLFPTICPLLSLPPPHSSQDRSRASASSTHPDCYESGRTSVFFITYPTSSSS